jgi:hypothetical protein
MVANTPYHLQRRRQQPRRKKMLDSTLVRIVALGAKSHLPPYPIEILEGWESPSKEGESYYFTNKSGDIIRYPSAYNYPMEYWPSTKRVEVGKKWMKFFLGLCHKKGLHRLSTVDAEDSIDEVAEMATTRGEAEKKRAEKREEVRAEKEWIAKNMEGLRPHIEEMEEVLF